MSLNLDPGTWRLQTLLGIPYKLKEGTPTIGASRDGQVTVKETYIMRASDLFAFIGESLPTSIGWPGGVWAYIPARAYPGLSYLLTQNIESKPFDSGLPGDPAGADSGAPSDTYDDFVEVAITYGTREATTEDEDEDDPEAFLEISADPAAEIISGVISGDALWKLSGTENWTDPDTDKVYAPGDNVPVKDMDNVTARIIPQTEWTVRFPLVTSAVAAIIIKIARPFFGKVNSAAMPVLKGAAVGTVLLTSVSLRETYSYSADDGIIKQNQLEFKFSEKRVDEDGIVKGWNWFYIKEVRQFELVYVNSKLVYGTANLNLLWS